MAVTIQATSTGVGDQQRTEDVRGPQSPSGDATSPGDVFLPSHKQDPQQDPLGRLFHNAAKRGISVQTFLRQTVSKETFLDLLRFKKEGSEDGTVTCCFVLPSGMSDRELGFRIQAETQQKYGEDAIGFELLGHFNNRKRDEAEEAQVVINNGSGEQQEAQFTNIGQSIRKRPKVILGLALLFLVEKEFWEGQSVGTPWGTVRFTPRGLECQPPSRVSRVPALSAFVK